MMQRLKPEGPAEGRADAPRLGPAAWSPWRPSPSRTRPCLAAQPTRKHCCPYLARPWHCHGRACPEPSACAGNRPHLGASWQVPATCSAGHSQWGPAGAGREGDHAGSLWVGWPHPVPKVVILSGGPPCPKFWTRSPGSQSAVGMGAPAVQTAHPGIPAPWGPHPLESSLRRGVERVPAKGPQSPWSPHKAGSELLPTRGVFAVDQH